MVSNKSFECKVCNKVFAKKGNLAKHAKSHGKRKYLITKPMRKTKGRSKQEEEFACGICAEIFTTLYELEAHENIHLEDGTVEALEDFKAEVKRRHEGKVYECSVCRKTFPSKFKLMRHQHIHMTVKPYPCDVCGRRFSRKDHLQVHYRIHTGEKICYCMDCGQGFNTTTALHRHIARLHAVDRSTYMCAMCDLEFAFKSQLKRHFDCTHRRSFTCEFCGNISNSEDALYRHLRKHILTEPFVCLMCSAAFGSSEEMAQHQCCPMVDDPCKVVVRITLPDLFGLDYEIDPVDEKIAQRLQRKFDNRGRKPTKKLDDVLAFDTPKHPLSYQPLPAVSLNNQFRCKFCEMEFSTEADKLAHEQRHIESATNFTCSICKVKCASNAKLKRHLRIHTGENPFRCKFCPKVFPRKEFLQRHMFNVHVTDDNTCPYCFLFFPSAEELTEHLHSHADPQEPQTHFCDTCDTYFAEYHELRAHMLDVHSSAYFKCQYCDTSFHNKTMLVNHEETCSQNASISEENVKMTLDDNLYATEEESLQFQLHSCDLCEAVFSSFLDKIKHLKMIHKPAFYTCDLCPCKFVSSIALRNHRITVHEDESLKKELAQFKLHSRMRKKRTKPDLEHVPLNHAADIHHCKDVLHEDFLEDVQHHSYANLPNEELQCVLCDETFVTTEALTQHLHDHDDNMIVEVGVHDGENEESDVPTAHVTAN